MSDLIVSTLTQGLICALLSYGVYITYSVLDFPDLTVDSSFPLGAAVTAILLLGGVDPWLTLLCAAGAGALAGLCTGLIHVRLGVRDLLAGIITMTALSSVNLLIAGSNVTVERAVDTIFTSAPVMALLGDLTLSARKLIVALVLAVVVKLLLDLYFRTKSGLLLRAVGDNGTLVTTLAQNKGNMKVLGVVIANALVALCGGAAQLFRGHGHWAGGFWLGYRHHWNFSHPIFHPVQGLPEPAEGQGPAVPGHPPGDHSGAAGEHSI